VHAGLRVRLLHSEAIYDPAGFIQVDAGELQSLLAEAFPRAELSVASPDGVHFKARIVSEAFSGASRIARHQKVYAALGERVGGEIHALSLETLAPEEQ
jgi:acid stress-induced BolA-like protein IbaG/YrbA